MVRFYRSSPTVSRANRRGFALLITITLLAFLVLLLVSLASLTRVETQVAANNKQVSEARQNALMALNIALGQLQKYAGPDQRITATADLFADKDKAGVAAPSPLHATTVQVDVKPGSRYWTSVWGNTESAINYSLRPNQIPPTASGGNRRGMTPGLLNWLISGNESATYSAKGTEGGVNAGAGITYAPGDAVDLTDLANPKVKNTPAVVLVGANTVGTGATAQKDYVVAPLKDIEVAASSVPGADPTSSTPVKVGRYAWWVGDEGVKARVNLQNGYQKTGVAADQINSFLTAQRSAIELMDRDPAGTTSPTRIGTDYDFTSASLVKIAARLQFPLIGSDAAAQGNLSTAVRNRFHDITASSYGVLSDTYAGGLKKDLTADIADASSSSAYRPADDDEIYPALPSVPADPNRPTWGLIRNWARARPNSGGELSPVPPSSTNGGVYPTIAYFSLGFNYYLEGSVLKFALYPIISLHNPYPVPIAAADYELALRFSNQCNFTVQFDPEGGAPFSYNDVATISMNTLAVLAAGDTTTATSPTFLRFRIQGRRIPPGQRQIYVLPDPLHNSTYNHAAPLTLERAPDTALGLGESNFFVLNGPSLDLSGATVNARIRLRMANNYTTTSSRFTEVSLALGSAGSFSSSTWNPLNAGIYQAMHGVYPTQSANASFANTDGAVSGSAFYCATTAVGELVSNKTVPPTFANSAFRVATGYEAGGWWSSQWKMGFLHGYYPSRVIADGSLRAPRMMATGLENYEQRPDGNNRSVDQRVGAGIFGARIADTTQDQGRDPHPGVAYFRYSTGVDGGPDNSNTVDGTRYSILWDILESPDRLLSLGQLQHVPFSSYDFQPSYLFGNSYANKRISRNITYNTAKLRKVDEAPTVAPSLPLYDESWHLNRAIWDKYFVSGVPSSLTQADIDAGTPLPNARMTPYRRAATASPTLSSLKYTGGSGNTAYDQASANLLVAGAFNINSTSEQAWRAVLAGTYRIPLNAAYASSGDAVETSIPYPRFTHNLAQAGDTVYPARPTTMKAYPALTGPGENNTQAGAKVRNTLHLGNRGLYLNAEAGSIPEQSSPEAVVAELARAVVQEIRLRGPFLSLSDFINRPLTDPSFSTPSNPNTSATPDPKKIAGIKGALQAAIDNMRASAAQVNPVTVQQRGTSGMKNGQAYPYYNWDSEHAVGGFINPTTTYPADQVHRSPFAMAPKMLTQADLLSTLGPSLSARSDTFTIRAYGEKTNPVTNTTEGRAWCEAVVQRVPDYVDASQSAYSTAAGANITHGRRFQIVSLRWLSPQDI